MDLYTDKLILWHGSSMEITTPDLSKSRDTIDFGRGFYLTKDYNTAIKWACRRVKTPAFVNRYELDCNGLDIKEFTLNEEWLEFVLNNRHGANTKFTSYDLIIGAIADDKLFGTIDLFERGLISIEGAIMVINSMKIGNQYVLKTNKALEHLTFLNSIEIKGSKRTKYEALIKEDSKRATERTEMLLKQINRR